MSVGLIWTIVKRSVSEFIADDCLNLAAALAYYTALSLAPLVVLLLTVSTFFGEQSQQKFVNEVQQLVGAQAGQSIKQVIDSADSKPNVGTIAGWISLGVLVFSATGVFAQLQDSLNRIWDVKAKPSAGWWEYLRKRLLSLGMLVTIGFLLLVSLVLSSVLHLVLGSDGKIWEFVNFAVSLLVFVGLFAAMYKLLPDVQIPWGVVWTGACVTGVLFVIGKWAIGLYLGYSSVGSSYGAAGSLIVLLLWVYYSSLILFFGAELTQVYATETKAHVQPDQYAEWSDDEHAGAAAEGAAPTPANRPQPTRPQSSAALAGAPAGARVAGGRASGSPSKQPVRPSEPEPRGTGVRPTVGLIASGVGLLGLSLLPLLLGRGRRGVATAKLKKWPARTFYVPLPD
jgi:membrane protein